MDNKDLHNCICGYDAPDIEEFAMYNMKTKEKIEVIWIEISCPICHRTAEKGDTIEEAIKYWEVLVK